MTLHKIADMCSSLFKPVSFDEDKEEEEQTEKSMKQRRMTMLLEMAAKKLPIILPEEVTHSSVYLDENVVEKDLKGLNYKLMPLQPLNPPLFASELPYANIPMRQIDLVMQALGSLKKNSEKRQSLLSSVPLFEDEELKMNQ